MTGSAQIQTFLQQLGLSLLLSKRWGHRVVVDQASLSWKTISIRLSLASGHVVLLFEDQGELLALVSPGDGRASLDVPSDQDWEAWLTGILAHLKLSQTR